MHVAASSRSRIARRIASVTFAACVVLAATRVQAEFAIPRLSGPVVDGAGMLSPSTEARLDAALRALKDQGGTQLAVLTVKTLEGLSIEQASIQVVDKWKLGSEREDDGVLLMIARDERKIHIEVGQGREGDLTDAHAKRIIDESMTPLFRAGEIDAGVTVGVFQIAKRTNPEVDLASMLEGGATHGRRVNRQRSSPLSVLMFLLIAAVVGMTRMGRFGYSGRYRRGGNYYWGAGGIGAGRGLGGGSFGGGFGGGGGGFSGGGASGGW